MNNTFALEMRGISKSFPGVKALDDVNLEVRPGSVHVIVGENGAGKSTLMKVLSGLYIPDAGEIFIEGQQVTIKNPQHALDLGISIIQQELATAPEMTIAECIFLNREPAVGIPWLVNYKEMYAHAQQILDERNLHLSAHTKMKELSIAQKQMVEIAKAVSFQAKVIIMDEPTSAITEREVAELFDIVQELKANNVSVLYISHKMEELEQIADDVTILRDGKYIGSWPMRELTREVIISRMVGRDITHRYPKEETATDEVVLKAENLTIDKSFENISFELHRGEVLGLSGLMGAGRTEVARAIFGMDKLDGGELYVHGKKVRIKNPTDAIKNRIAMVTEDRRKYGVVLCRSILENISLPNLKKFRGWRGIDKKKERTEVAKYYDRLSIKSPNLETVTENLSGGNQQKVVLAKWLMSRPDIIIMDEPTRGIDVGAKFEIYQLMNEMTKEGISIIFISSELPEILGMCDRIMVMAQGEAMALIDRKDATQEKIMHYATGSDKMDMEGVSR